MEHIEILIIGGGAAGIGAARGAWESGGRSIMLVDRENDLGGILRQCAHRGFGAGQTGTEYRDALTSDLPSDMILRFGTTVLEIKDDKTAVLAGKDTGVYTVGFDALILAAGCVEIPVGALNIAGTRPAGVYTAGQMQAMMNLDGYVPDGPAVILGSGDMGLIMANQLYDAGVPVTVIEQKTACGAMARNRKKVASGEIPLLCERTITRLNGTPRLESVTLSDGAVLQCRTLLTAVGLKPDRELIRTVGIPEWLHLCGNCREIHPMVEAVFEEGKQIGAAAHRNLRGAK